MSKVYYPVTEQNVCKSCQHSKDRFKESCFCLKYGIMITYGKAKCNGYEQVRKSENNS